MAITLQIKLADLSAHYEKSAKALKAAIKRGIVKTAAQAVTVAQAQLIPSRTPQPVDRGNYKRAWKYRATASGALVYNDSPYASIVEHGVPGSRVKPGPTMRAAIREWAQRKGLRPRKTSPKMSDDAAWTALVWAIVMSMKRKGIMNGGRGWGINLELGNKLIPVMLKKNVVAELEAAMKGDGKK